MNKMFRVLEIFWLVVGLVAIIMSSYSIITKDSKSALYFIVITFASGLMYAMRKRQRVKFEQAEKEREKKK
ncbi:MAG: hypothetical protein ACXVPY_16120 [Bacteroidia bacterium]